MIQLLPSQPGDMDEVKRHLGYRLPYHHPDVPFIASWSHKAGCTVLLRWYLFQAHLLLEASSYDKGRGQMRLHQYERDVFKARPGYRRDLLQAVAAGKPLILFVRCPFARAFSSYLQVNSPQIPRIEQRGQQSRMTRLRREIQFFTHGREMPLDTPMPFMDYLRWLQAQDPDGVNRHHAPQHSALLDHCQVNFFRLKHLADTARALERDLGLRSSGNHPKMFKTKHAVPKFESNSGAAEKLLDEGITLQRTKRDPIPAISRDLLQGRPEGALIQEVFAKDVALYDSIPE